MPGNAMSITAKQTLVREIERTMKDKLTAADLVTLTDAISVCLAKYDVSRLPDADTGQEFDDMMDAFLSAKRIEGRSDKTIAYYRYVLSRLKSDANIPIRDITVFTLRSFLSKEQSRGIADRTLEGYRCVFSSFFGWLQKEGLLPSNPCANLSPIKCMKKVRTPYSDIDIECLKEACDNSRDKALVSFLLSTGCRISEVCGLDRDSIDFSGKECTVLGKGNKERTVFLDDVTSMLLQRYLSERTDPYNALFVGKGSERMTPGGIRAKLKTIAERASVDNVHPHRFRRTLATGLIDRGMKIQDVAAILGHEKLDTTMKYVYIDKNNVKNEYRKFI